MSDYIGFDVYERDANGILVPLAEHTVTVWDGTNNEALDDLETDANGNIPNGTLDVDAGTVIYFTATINGKSRTIKRTTT